MHLDICPNKKMISVILNNNLHGKHRTIISMNILLVVNKYKKCQGKSIRCLMKPSGVLDARKVSCKILFPVLDLTSNKYNKCTVVNLSTTNYCICR